MKKFFKLSALTVSLMLALNLFACGSSDEDVVPDDNNDTPNIETSDISEPDSPLSDLMTKDELVGEWDSFITEAGDQIVLDLVENTYTYRTWYGRIGDGYLYDIADDGVQLEFGDFVYDFVREDDGFTLSQNGSSDEESLAGMHFMKTGSSMPLISTSMIGGIWQNALGETLVIDTDRMEYISCTQDGLGSGTLYDKNDGRGLYLFLNGFAYPAMSVSDHSFELFFIASDTQSPDGTFSGVFYRNGDAEAYADIENAGFVELGGHMWYYDGVEYFALPEGYHIADDGLAYDEAGNVFAAGWDAPLYDPADDWGEGWADNWN